VKENKKWDLQNKCTYQKGELTALMIQEAISKNLLLF
jgi:hypothetical protein